MTKDEKERLRRRIQNLRVQIRSLYIALLKEDYKTADEMLGYFDGAVSMLCDDVDDGIDCEEVNDNDETH